MSSVTFEGTGCNGRSLSTMHCNEGLDGGIPLQVLSIQQTPVILASHKDIAEMTEDGFPIFRLTLTSLAATHLPSHSLVTTIKTRRLLCGRKLDASS